MAKKKNGTTRALPRTGAARGAAAVVILAAGEGKRMKSALPKVLQPLAGVPLLKRVVDTARALRARLHRGVYGHGGEAVRAALADEQLTWVLQQERRGTGHAVQQALPHIEDGARVLVLYGDVPLICACRLSRNCCSPAGNAGVSLLLSVELDEPEGYGRVVRNARRPGAEDRRAEGCQSPRSSSCGSATPAYWSPPRGGCARWLAAVRPHNAQGEYYLTDVIALAVKSKVPVTPLIAPRRARGARRRTTRCSWRSSSRRMARRSIAQELLRAGVTLADPARLDVRGTLSHGSDVSLDVNVVSRGPCRPR
jgi:bifunctional UDP-N-acetylglucosamine pyrophosphorylase/glucosamine-1-phosphate N-acetyltransferase